jgi:hypothetical protein
VTEEPVVLGRLGYDTEVNPLHFSFVIVKRRHVFWEGEAIFL